MKTNRLSLKLVKYEVINTTSNIFVIIFGLIFPLGMTLLFTSAFGSEVPDKTAFATEWFIRMALIIPLATMFMGHAASYAGELESGAVLRFKLFGFSERTMVAAKLIANMIFATVSFAIYSLIITLVLPIAVPSIGALFTFIIFFFIYSAIVFVLGHAVATMCGRFGSTFGIIMALYFGLMILGGNMGIEPSALPEGLRQIAMAFPGYYIATYFYGFWAGGGFEWLGFLLSTLGFAAVVCGLFVLALWLKKKGKIKEGSKPVYYD